MALTISTFADELEKMTYTDDYDAAAEDFASAFTIYFYESMAGAIGVADGSLATAQAALETALKPVEGVGGIASDASTAIETGIAAFWAALSVAAATVYYDEVETASPLGPAISVTPPPLMVPPLIKDACDTAFASNTSGSKSLADSATELATEIHATQSGGICVFPLVINGGLGPLPIV